MELKCELGVAVSTEYTEFSAKLLQKAAGLGRVPNNPFMATGNPKEKGSADITANSAGPLWLWLPKRWSGPAAAALEGETRHLLNHCLKISGICPLNIRGGRPLSPSRPSLADEIILLEDGTLIITGS